MGGSHSCPVSEKWPEEAETGAMLSLEYSLNNQQLPVKVYTVATLDDDLLRLNRRSASQTRRMPSDLLDKFPGVRYN